MDKGQYHALAVKRTVGIGPRNREDLLRDVNVGTALTGRTPMVTLAHSHFDSYKGVYKRGRPR